MSNTYNSASALFTGICDAIRTKDGTSAGIAHQDIPARILAIPSGGGGSATLINKSITQNGTYMAANEGADGYDEVTVNVTPVLITKRIEQNGTYYPATDNPNAVGFGAVIVDVPTGGYTFTNWAYLFRNGERPLSELQDIVANSNNVTNFRGAFSQVPDGSVLDFAVIFSKASAQGASFEDGLYNASTTRFRYNFQNLDTVYFDRITNMSYAFYNTMFSGSTSPKSNPKVFKFGLLTMATDMSYMFANANTSGYSDYESFDFSDSNCSPTAVDHMFYNRNNALIIDLSGLTINAPINHMFYYCTKLEDLTLPTITTTNANYAFYHCDNLDLSDLSAISLNGSASNMFANCYGSGQTVIDIGHNWRITAADSMFSGCSYVAELDFTNVDMSACTNVNDMFSYCTRLVRIINLDIGAATSSTISMFGSSNNTSCTSITMKNNATYTDAEDPTPVGWFFGPNKSSSYTLNLTRLTALTASGYETLVSNLIKRVANRADFLDPNKGNHQAIICSGSRTIKINTNLYNALTAEQKALVTNKGYQLTYGTS